MAGCRKEIVNAIRSDVYSFPDQIGRKLFAVPRSLSQRGPLMTTLTQSLREIRKPWQWVAIGGAILLVWVVAAIPAFYRANTVLIPRTLDLPPAPESYSASPLTSNAVSMMSRVQVDQTQAAATTAERVEAGPPRKIIRTSSLEMIVAHPADATDKITALAENLGGYIETLSSSGPEATSASLTLRLPADRFEPARAEIRKLGVRVTGERVDAQDVTRQYVDQDATLRNLRAEEAQYLTILKQASTVKDMLAVSERLSEVRGQIGQQEAEFRALSRQIETVSIAISLRTEAEAQSFGLNWRPLYQLKLALRDGLESLATYATAMITILFYLPAALLWVGTILLGFVVSWKIVRWIAVRCFGWVPAGGVVRN